MMQSFRILLTVLTFLPFSSVFSQVIQPCASDEYLADQITNNSQRIHWQAESDAEIDRLIKLQDLSAESVLQKIPVVIHIMYHNQAANISDAQVHSAMAILNEDFRRLNPDTANLRSIFHSVAADMEIEFELAQIDPSGNCSNGITRTQTSLSTAANNNVKNLIGWDNKKYLNIWVVTNIERNQAAGTIILGYSAFPYFNIPLTQDGIVIRHDNFGDMGSSAGTRHRTLTHEVGHYLNLYHTFQSGCTGGDNCYDTPPVSTSSSGCNTTLPQNTCQNDNPDLPDMLENYMDYSSDNCMNTFTLNQKSRAKAVLASSTLRGQLSSASNLFSTGLSGSSISCNPSAAFDVSRTLACVGDLIDLFDQSAFQSAVSYLWEVKNTQTGALQTFMSANPQFTLSQDGLYQVKLSILNGQGSDSETKTNLLTIRPAGGTTHSPYFYAGMEDPLPNSIWTVEGNGDNKNWARSTNVKQTGNASYYHPNFNVSNSSDGDALIAGPIALSSANSLTLKFAHAFARKTVMDDDQLKVYVSTDCGASWSLVRITPAFQLGTSALVPSSPYVPQASDWKETTVMLSAYKNNPHLMIKFEMVSGGGNNLYMDDVRLTYGVTQDEVSQAQWVLMPNPSHGMAVLAVNHPNHGMEQVRILNLNGQLLHQMDWEGPRMALPVLPAGSYVIQLTGSGTREHLRWVQLH
jgi:hypothetical protein